jgi:xylulokinase
MGERSPHWDPFARGAFVGLNRRHTRGHLVRAVMEGVALNLRIILDAFRRQGISPPAIRLIGGGAKSRLWRHIMADAWGVPVLLARYLEEGTSLGAAIAGGVGVGIFPSLEVAEEIVQMEEQLDPSGAQSVYEDLYPLFEQSYAALAPVYQRLAPLQGQT